MPQPELLVGPRSVPYAIILAGGAGTRFWPASRQSCPKQLLPLGADPTEPLLAATVRRIQPICPADHVYIATGEHLRSATHAVIPAVPKENLLCEPVPRNTAPGIGWATHQIARRDPGALVMVFPADHVVADEQSFHAALQTALALASRDFLVTVGVTPSRPETGYGYIELGASLAATSYEVARFVEKPNRSRAEAFVAGQRHLWNSGMFFFRASVMQAAIREHLPALAAGLQHLDAAAKRGDEANHLATTFASFPSVSIDHGIMEQARQIAVVQAEFGWNDVGSWESAWQLAPKDAAGNSDSPSATFVESTGNLVHSVQKTGNRRAITLLGVNDFVIVETDDALLIMPRSRAQDVRQVVDALRKSNPSLL